jgi:hypothetical protein
MFRLITVPVVLMVVIGCDDKRPEPAMSEKIWDVTKVTIEVMESDPPQLSITAEGRVTSAGWTDPGLDPIIYVAPPADGIYDFIFNAVPPGNASAQIITPIKATHVVESMPVNLKGVRIHAAQNQITERLIGTAPKGE